MRRGREKARMGSSGVGERLEPEIVPKAARVEEGGKGREAVIGWCVGPGERGRG